MGLWKDKIRGDWRYSFQYRGKIYAGGGFETKGKARDGREDRRKIATLLRPISGGLVLSQVIVQYLRESERRFAKKTHEYKEYVFKTFFEFNGDCEIGDLAPQQIYAYLSTRPSNSNFNRHRKELGVLLNFAKNKLRAIRENPMGMVDRLPETKFIKYIPPKEDVMKVLAVANSKEKPLLLVILHTLARIDEILRLTWEDINLEVQTLRLWTRKTMDGSLEPSTMPINDDLLEVMKALKDAKVQNKWVFWNRKENNRYNRRPKFMNGLCKRAKVKPFGFHSIRHFGATYLASKGVAHKTLSGLLRHHSLQTTDIYLQSLDEAKVEAVKQFEGVFMLAGDACGNGLKGPQKPASSAKNMGQGI